MLRKTRIAAIAATVLLAVLVLTRPAPAQDLTTMLSKFLVDLRSGTLGVNQPITSNTVTNSGIAATSTDGSVITNTTAATAGVTVQQSPRLKFCGAAWNSGGGASETDCWLIEVLPATVAGTTTAQLNFKSSINGAAFGNVISMASSGSITAQTAGVINFLNRQRFASPATGLLNVLDANSAFGVQINTGTAAPTSGCTVTSGSVNTAGEITATGASTCTITFGTPNWTNAPFCTITPEAVPTTTPVVNGSPVVGSFVVSNLTAGDNLKFAYHCIGRI